jgi:hypothetical protein
MNKQWLVRAFLLFFIFEALLRRIVGGEAWTDLVVISASYSLGYVLVWWLTSRYCLLRVSLLFLSLPYFFFAIGWLSWPLAIVFLSVFLWALTRVLSVAGVLFVGNAYSAPDKSSAISSAAETISVGWQGLLGFLILILWVHLSGAGGQGFQSVDYIAHNGRLKELIDYAWPLRYGDGRTLTFYVGYYLPAAAVGKYAGFSAAYAFMYFWTLCGVSLAWRWLCELTEVKWVAGAAVLLVLFSGWDAVVYLYQTRAAWGHADYSLLSPMHFLIDLWAGELLHFNIGAYLSNTFQLYYAPHQIIAGWIIAAMLLHFHQRNQWKVMGFVYGLYALWAPLLLLAVLPLMLLLYVSASRLQWRSAWSAENMLGGGFIAVVFGVFYLSGNALTNPSGWLWRMIDVSVHWPVVLLMQWLSWGIYVLLLLPGILLIEPAQRRGFLPLVMALAFLPLYWYGEWADLMCRGSAPLMFLLLVFIVRVANLMCQQQRVAYACVLILMLIPGSVSALRHMDQSLKYYPDKQQRLPEFFLRSIDSPTASEYVGSEQTFFFRYLAKPVAQP